MVFNAIFNIISAMSWREFFQWRKLEYLEKTNDLLQVTDKLDYIILFEVHLAISGIQTHYARYIAIEL